MNRTAVVTQPETPWPVVPECHSGFRQGHTCLQHDGAHDHRFVAWHQAPRVSSGTVVVGQQSGPGLPARCAVCGGRKCDMPDCSSLRHHRGPHVPY